MHRGKPPRSIIRRNGGMFWCAIWLDEGWWVIEWMNNLGIIL